MKHVLLKVPFEITHDPNRETNIAHQSLHEVRVASKQRSVDVGSVGIDTGGSVLITVGRYKLRAFAVDLYTEARLQLEDKVADLWAPTQSASAETS